MYRTLTWTPIPVLLLFSSMLHGGEKTGWISLIRGSDLDGWRQPTGAWVNAGGARLDESGKKLVALPGKGTVINGPGTAGRTGHLFSELQHGDIEAHIEFMVPRGSNSGVYFMGRYEIQVLDSFAGVGRQPPEHGDCGGIYQRWDRRRGRGKEGYEGHPPLVNSSRAPGEWQTFDVIFRAPRFDDTGKRTSPARFVKILHNGILVHADVDLGGPTRAAAVPEERDEAPAGPLMLQGDHGPVAYREIRIRHLKDGLLGDRGRTIDGKTLRGWAAELRHRDPAVRSRAAVALGKFGTEALGLLNRALGDADPAVRQAAAAGIGRLELDDRRRARLALQRALEDDSAGVRAAALRALRGTGERGER